jgi:hypothetical protein
MTPLEGLQLAAVVTAIMLLGWTALIGIPELVARIRERRAAKAPRIDWSADHNFVGRTPEQQFALTEAQLRDELRLAWQTAGERLDHIAVLNRRVAVLEQQLAAKERLRARYLRLLRAERARTRFLFDARAERRFPSQEALKAVVLELPRQQHLRLVPPLVARAWDDAAVA